jgi:hypothetical protein
MPGTLPGFKHRAPGYCGDAVKRGFLVAVGLALLAAPESAQADPRADVTFFSDPGHFVGAGWEQRWSSEDEHIATDLSGSTLTVAVGPEFDAEVKHWFSFSAPSGQPLEPGVYRVPMQMPKYSPDRPAIDITAYYGSLVVSCPYLSPGTFEVRDLAGL